MLEQVISDCWREALGWAPALYDDFYTQGGTSLTAVKCTTLVSAYLGIPISPALLLANPTFIDFSAQVASAVLEDKSASAPMPQIGAYEGPPPLSINQDSHLRWLGSQNKTTNRLIPVYIYINSSLGDAELISALRSVIDSHEALRSGFVSNPGNEPAQLICAGNYPPVEIRGVSSVTADSPEIIENVRELIGSAMPLAVPPLLRVRICRSNAREVALLLAVEHLVFDGWSKTVLARDLAEVLQRGGPHSADRLQMAHWAAWQRKYLYASNAGWLWKFWRQALAETGPLPDLNVPKAKNSAAPMTSRVTVSFDRFQVSNIRRYAVSVSATVFVIMLAVIADAFGKLTESDRIVVHSPHVNRTAIGSANIIGFLAHSIAYPVRRRKKLDWRTYVTQIRDVVLACQMHGDLPLPLLDQAFHQDSAAGRRRIPRVFVSYEKAVEAQFPIPDGWLACGGKPAAGLSVLEIPDSSIMISIVEEEDRAIVGIYYNSGLVDSDFIDFYSRQLSRGLRSMINSSVDY